MLSINMSDVMNVINSIKSYLIAIGIIILAAIIIQIAVSKMAKPGKRLIRGTAFIAALAGICVCVNMICTGPMSTMLDLISGSGTISEETSGKQRGSSSGRRYEAQCLWLGFHESYAGRRRIRRAERSL